MHTFPLLSLSVRALKADAARVEQKCERAVAAAEAEADMKCKVASAQLAQNTAECETRVAELQTQLGARARGSEMQSIGNTNNSQITVNKFTYFQNRIGPIISTFLFFLSQEKCRVLTILIIHVPRIPPSASAPPPDHPLAPAST